MRRDKRVDSVTEVPWPASRQLMRRQRWYFLLMGVCLTLIVLAWTWVRLWSVPLAVGMSASPRSSRRSRRSWAATG